MSSSSTPTFSEFDPTTIPFQDQVVDDVLCNYDYKKGAHEILLSGSVGSAKSILMAHLAVRHCLEFAGARILICRKALPQLRETIYTKIIEHLDQDNLKQGRDYFANDSTCTIRFKNKSEILSGSWSDKKYKKFRSYELSAAIIEEGTENTEEDKQAIMEIKMRIGRLPHIPHKWMMIATNPDSTRHWLYKYFFESVSETRHVYLSKTHENPYLPTEYIEQLKQDLDPKMARRMLYGEWIDLDEEKIYHAYLSDRNFKKNEAYAINKMNPIMLNFDFNIGEGKPMSSCAYQFINDEFHVFDKKIVHGARTQDIMDEWFDSGIFNHGCEIIVHGDATGSRRDTRSVMSDWDIVKKFLSNISGLKFRMEVPRDNPPIRTRHNRVNAYCFNEAKKVRLFLYKGCELIDEGLRLTAFKKGGNMVEDDSFHAQHVTTALGYGIVYDTNKAKGNFTFSSGKG